MISTGTLILFSSASIETDQNGWETNAHSVKEKIIFQITQSAVVASGQLKGIQTISRKTWNSPHRWNCSNCTQFWLIFQAVSTDSTRNSDASVKVAIKRRQVYNYQLVLGFHLSNQQIFRQSNQENHPFTLTRKPTGHHVWCRRICTRLRPLDKKLPMDVTRSMQQLHLVHLSLPLVKCLQPCILKKPWATHFVVNEIGHIFWWIEKPAIVMTDKNVLPQFSQANRSLRHSKIFTINTSVSVFLFDVRRIEIPQGRTLIPNLGFP